jgi:hypothetical protein
MWKTVFYIISRSPIFATKSTAMTEEEFKAQDDREFGKNWVTSSHFIFVMSIITFFAFFVGCSSHMYSYRYTGHPKVKIQSSTLYTPQYDK